MTGFEPATPGATVPRRRDEEAAPRRVVLSDADLCAFEEGWSDPNDTVATPWNAVLSHTSRLTSRRPMATRGAFFRDQ